MTTSTPPPGPSMPPEDAKTDPIEREPPVFTPQLDDQILGGLVEDEGALLREMAEHGHAAAAVRRRAALLGLTDQVVLRCRIAGTRPSMRECLACERRFLSTGAQHRLCKRCRLLR